jgi:hypothetical protein
MVPKRGTAYLLEFPRGPICQIKHVVLIFWIFSVGKCYCTQKVLEMSNKKLIF